MAVATDTATGMGVGDLLRRSSLRRCHISTTAAIALRVAGSRSAGADLIRAMRPNLCFGASARASKQPRSRDVMDIAIADAAVSLATRRALCSDAETTDRG